MKAAPIIITCAALLLLLSVSPVTMRKSRPLPQQMTQATDTPAISDAARAPVLGDVNADGHIDASDASDLLVASTEKAVGHAIGLTDAQQAAADIDKDGQFDAMDASYILIYSTLSGTGKAVTFEALTAADA